MKDFRMDRRVVSKSTFKEADDQVTFSKDKSPIERINLAFNIINSIFNSTPNCKVDRTITSSRKHAKSI